VYIIGRIRGTEKLKKIPICYYIIYRSTWREPVAYYLAPAQWLRTTDLTQLCPKKQLIQVKNIGKYWEIAKIVANSGKYWEIVENSGI